MTKPVPPYFAFGTFKAFLVKLRGNGIPSQIDKSLMEDKPPAIRSQLRNSLHFFGLIDDKNEPTFDLRELVRLIEARNGTRDETWKRVLTKGYPDLLERDLQHATTQVIRDSLLRQGLSSQNTLNKAVNFFCLAVKEARIPLSGNIKPYLGRRKAGKKKTLKDERQGELFNSSTSTYLTPTNGLSALELLIAKLPSLPPFNESWPDEWKENWFQHHKLIVKLIVELIDELRKLVTGNEHTHSK